MPNGTAEQYNTNGPIGKSGLGRRIFYGSVAQFMVLSMRLLQQIVLVPIFLSAWGESLYAEWLILFAAAGFILILDFGLEAYFTPVLLKAWSQNNIGRFNFELQVAIGLYSGILVVTGALLGIVFSLLDLPASLNIKTMDPISASITLAVLAIASLALLPQGLFLGIYRARGEFSVGSMLLAVFLTLHTVAIAGALLFGISPVGVALSYLGSILISWMLLIFSLFHRYPDLRLGLRCPSRDDIWTTFSKSGLYFINLLANTALLHGPVILLGLLATDQTYVLLFVVSRLLVGIVRQFAHFVAHVLGNEMGRQSAQGDTEALRHLFISSGRLIGGLTGLASGVALVIAPPFITLWTHGRIRYDAATFLPLLGSVLAIGPAQVCTTFMIYTLRPGPLASASLGQCIVSAIAGLALIPTFGAAGAAWALGVGETLTFGIFVVMTTCSLIAVPTTRLLAVTYGATAAMAIISFGTGFAISHLWTLNNYAHIVYFTLLWAAIVFLPSFFGLFSLSQRRSVMESVIQYLRPLANTSIPASKRKVKNAKSGP